MLNNSALSFRVTLTSVMKYLDQFLHAKASFWLLMPIRYKSWFLAPSWLLFELLSLFWINVLVVSRLLSSCEGGSSTDGGQLLPGVWSSAGNHPHHQQGTLRPTCCCCVFKLFSLISHVSLRSTWKTLIQREWRHRLRGRLISHETSAFGWVGTFANCLLVSLYCSEVSL